MANFSLIRGEVYRVRLTNGTWHNARFIRDVVYNPTFGNASYMRNMRSTTHYLFQNLDTGRDVEIKSKVRIREAQGLHTPSVPQGFNQERG